MQGASHVRQADASTLNLRRDIAAANATVREAYQLMRRPPKHQLFDLQNDPYEFTNLAASPDHADILQDLRQRLDQWRVDTQDPLLDEQRLEQLSKEVRSIKKRAIAKKHQWNYPNYLRALATEE